MQRLKNFSYFEPASVNEAVETLAGEEGAFPLAGGTDLLVRMKRREIHPAALVNLKHIRSLSKIKSKKILENYICIRNIESKTMES